MTEPDEYGAINFCCSGQENHIIYTGELYPIKVAKFGPVVANIPAQPRPQLERGYGRNWDRQGQIHTNDHITKHSKDGPRQIFDVNPFINISANCRSEFIGPVLL